MFKCRECECEEYVLSDDNYISCRDCGALGEEQSHFMEKVQIVIDGRVDMTKHVTKVSKKFKEKQEGSEKEYPWTSDMGFQIIMMEQCSDLLNMGAHKELQDCVLVDLWMTFLRKCGRLGRKVSLAEAWTMPGFGRVRDKFPGTFKNPKIYPHHVVGFNLKRLSVIDEDDPERESKEELKKRLLVQKIRHEKEMQAGMLSHKMNMKECIAIQSMNMLKTLCFCYLGLKITSPTVEIFDLIRWVAQGRVCFMNLPKSWPTMWKFHYHDQLTFCPERIPTCEELFRETSRLYSFLDMPSIPKPDVTACAYKIIRELDLPRELFQSTKNLTDFPDPSEFLQNPFLTSTEPSSVAACYILMTLKAIFGLNGCSEKKHARYARWLSERIEFERPLFNFYEWLKSAMRSVEEKERMLKVGCSRNNVSACKTVAVAHSDRHFVKIRLKKGISVALKEIHKSCSWRHKHNYDDDVDDDHVLEAETNERIGQECHDVVYENDGILKIFEPSPFEDASIQYITDNEFLKKLTLNLYPSKEEKLKSYRRDGVVFCNDEMDYKHYYSRCMHLDESLERKVRFEGFQNQRGRPSHAPHKDKHMIKCCPKESDQTLESIIEEVPESFLILLPGLKRYRKRILFKENHLQRWLCWAEEKEGKLIEDNEHLKANAYLDVLKLLSKHIGLSYQHLEYRLEKLEKFVGENRLSRYNWDLHPHQRCWICGWKPLSNKQNENQRNDGSREDAGREDKEFFENTMLWTCHTCRPKQNVVGAENGGSVDHEEKGSKVDQGIRTEREDNREETSGCKISQTGRKRRRESEDCASDGNHGDAASESNKSRLKRQRQR